MSLIWPPKFVIFASVSGTIKCNVIFFLEELMQNIVFTCLFDIFALTKQVLLDNKQFYAKDGGIRLSLRCHIFILWALESK